MKSAFLNLRRVLASASVAGLCLLCLTAADSTSTGSSAFLASLTAEEREWLHAHPVIRVVQDPNWPPIEFADKSGNPTGMTKDYLTLIEQRLGQKFKPVLHLSWQEAYARLKRGEIDMTTTVAETPERLAFWAFTKPYMTIPIVIAARHDVSYIANMHELAGKKVAAVDGYAVNEWIPRDFPEVRLLKVKTSLEGLQQLQRGEVDAFIDSLATIGHYQATGDVLGLKIAGATPYFNAQRMAVRKDWAPFAGILQKALDSISEAERAEIFRRWLPVRYEHGFNYTLLWQASAGFAVVLLGLGLWNRRQMSEIRQRKGAELALKASNAQLQLLETCVSRLNDIVLITEAEPIGEPGPRIVFVNDAFVRRTGYSREEVIGKSPRILQGPKTDRKELDRIRAALERWEPVRAELLNYTKSGVEFWLELDIVPVADATGWFTHWIAVERDVTERRAADEKLRTSAIALKNISQGVVITDHNQRTLSANMAFSHITGYDEPEILGRNCDFLHGPLTDTEAKLRIRQAIKDGVEFNGEILNYHKNGTPFWNDLTISPVLNEEGVVIQYVGIMRDVTERKHAEEEREALAEQLRESQKMEAIGTLAGGIAHDFNNILAAIQGNTALALGDSASNPRAIESLDEIEKATTRARDLVRQILSFSRRQATTLKNMSLIPVAEESARLLRTTLPPRLSLRLDIAEDLPNVTADATQIQQILINLATNALQAMREGRGQIDIILDTVLLDDDYAAEHPQAHAMLSAHAGRTVRLVVRDNGTGMDAATRARVFEPFFTTKPVGEGTGLGLSVVHGIAQKHEGVIFLESELGQGTTFTLLLPVALESDESDPTLIAVEAPLKLNGGRHILYLDDDEALVFLCARLFERRGHRVTTFTNQADALAALQADPFAFDLFLTDYNMPGPSGVDVARAALAIRADLPVAMASGFVDESLQRAAADAGVVELIFKASDIDEFCDTVNRLAHKLGGQNTHENQGQEDNRVLPRTPD
ncbi:MAG: PAS domain-containing protein [Aeromicrobium sp.]|nr:PAS domain-containing protein [Burkholderiales bacterium]